MKCVEERPVHVLLYLTLIRATDWGTCMGSGHLANTAIAAAPDRTGSWDRVKLAAQTRSIRSRRKLDRDCSAIYFPQVPKHAELEDYTNCCLVLGWVQRSVRTVFAKHTEVQTGGTQRLGDSRILLVVHTVADWGKDEMLATAAVLERYEVHTKERCHCVR